MGKGKSKGKPSSRRIHAKAKAKNTNPGQKKRKAAALGDNDSEDGSVPGEELEEENAKQHYCAWSDDEKEQAQGGAAVAGM